MKTSSKILVGVISGILLVPSVTYAAWWNPSTWFKKPTVAPKTVQVGTTTPLIKSVVATPAPKVKKETPMATVKSSFTPPVKTADQSTEIEKLRKEVEELKKNRVNNPPTAIQQQNLPAQVLAPTKPSVAENTIVTLPSGTIVEIDAKGNITRFIREATQQTAQAEKALPAPTPVIKTPPNTTFCNGTNWTQCPTGQDFVCPASGNAYCQIPQQQVDLLAEQQRQQQLAEQQRQLYVQQQAVQQEETRRLQAEQQKNSQINSLLAEYRQKESDITQQILDIKQKYYQDFTLLEQQPISSKFIIGQQNNLLDKTNRKIEQLNLQLDQLKLDYRQRIQVIQ